MAIVLNSGRQEVIAAKLSVNYADMSSDVAVAEAVVDVPANAIVVGGYVVVQTVFNSTTSDVLDVGDGDNDDRYSATPIDLTTLGYNALDVTGYKYSVSDLIDVEWTAGTTSTATTGDFDIVVEYIVDGRAAFSQG